MVYWTYGIYWYSIMDLNHCVFLKTTLLKLFCNKEIIQPESLLWLSEMKQETVNAR